MPSYGTNPWLDLAGGTAGMQNSMANVALAQRQAQYRMQQEAAKQALEQQYLQIARQAEERQGRQTGANIEHLGAETKRADAETKKYGFETDIARQTMDTQQRIGRLRGYEGAPDIMSMIQDPTSGPQMMGDLRSANVVPQGQFQLTPQQIMQALHAALGSQVYQQGVGTPASAQRMTEPVIYGPNQTGVDPFSGDVLHQATPPPISDYQRQNLAINQSRAGETGRHNLSMEELRRRQVLAGVVAQLGHGFQTGDLMEGAREQLAGDMGVPYSPENNYTDIPPVAPVEDKRGIWDRLWNNQPTQQPAQQQQVPQPSQRKKGQKVTTAKGTFEWDGSAWQPVQ